MTLFYDKLEINESRELRFVAVHLALIHEPDINNVVCLCVPLNQVEKYNFYIENLNLKYILLILYLI